MKRYLRHKHLLPSSVTSAILLPLTIIRCAPVTQERKHVCLRHVAIEFNVILFCFNLLTIITTHFEHRPLIVGIHECFRRHTYYYRRESLQNVCKFSRFTVRCTELNIVIVNAICIVQNILESKND